MTSTPVRVESHDLRCIFIDNFRKSFDLLLEFAADRFDRLFGDWQSVNEAVDGLLGRLLLVAQLAQPGLDGHEVLLQTLDVAAATRLCLESI